jgi:protease I
MKALIVSGPLFEDAELLEPAARLGQAGIEVVLAASQAGPLRGKHGALVEARALSAVEGKDYDLLVLPGGKAPALLCKEKRLLDLVRDFMAAGKTVAAICHGPLVLAAAGVLAGRRVTCYRKVAGELQGAGARYLDAPVVVDDNLITARVPADLPDFLAAILARCRP